MRRRLEAERELLSALRVDSREWANDHIGTFHTVQGREADTVILLLGAPKASQGGGRSWAAGIPNILNVAVSRARQKLYVVAVLRGLAGRGPRSRADTLNGESANLTLGLAPRSRVESALLDRSRELPADFGGGPIFGRLSNFGASERESPLDQKRKAASKPF